MHRETSLWGKKLPPDEQAALDLELAMEEAKDPDGKPKQEPSSIGVRLRLSALVAVVISEGMNAQTLLLLMTVLLSLLLSSLSFERLQQNNELLRHYVLSCGRNHVVIFILATWYQFRKYRLYRV